MRPRVIAFVIAFVFAIGSTASADHPECETYAATQPDAMVTDVLVVYTWDTTCGPDPELGPLERDRIQGPTWTRTRTWTRTTTRTRTTVRPQATEGAQWLRSMGARRR